VSIVLQFLNNFARIRQVNTGRMLDKNQFSMIIYTRKSNIAMNGKSNVSQTLREPGALAENPGGNGA
jgi:hypothetical protein